MTECKARYLIMFAVQYRFKPWDVGRLTLPEFDAFVEDIERLLREGASGG